MASGHHPVLSNDVSRRHVNIRHLVQTTDQAEFFHRCRRLVASLCSVSEYAAGREVKALPHGGMSFPPPNPSSAGLSARAWNWSGPSESFLLDLSLE
jgi:hypothetical protein